MKKRRREQNKWINRLLSRHKTALPSGERAPQIKELKKKRVPMFNFRIDFVINGNFIDIKNEMANIIEHRKIRIQSSKAGKNISETKYLSVIGEDYSNYRSAGIDMLRMEQSLKLSSLKLNLGVSYESDKHNDAVEKHFLKTIESNFAPAKVIFSGILGTKVYESSTLIWDPEIHTSKDPVSSDEFISLVNKIYQDYDTDFELQEAIDLLNSSLFESSSKARLILSITAIEMLAPTRTLRSQEELKLLDSFADAVFSSNLDSNQKNSLSKAIMGCKRQSIGKSCRTLISEHLGKNKVSEFNLLYDYRSQAVHSGRLIGNASEAENGINEAFKYAEKAFLLANDLIDSLLKKRACSSEGWKQIQDSI